MGNKISEARRCLTKLRAKVQQQKADAKVSPISTAYLTELESKLGLLESEHQKNLADLAGIDNAPPPRKGPQRCEGEGRENRQHHAGPHQGLQCLPGPAAAACGMSARVSGRMMQPGRWFGAPQGKNVKASPDAPSFWSGRCVIGMGMPE